MIEALRNCYGSSSTPGLLLAIEGEPGAGKTIALEQFAHRVDVKLLPELNHLSASDTTGLTTTDATDGWYLDAELERQQQLTALLNQGTTVIQDRTFVSTVAYVYARSMAFDDGAYFQHFLSLATRRFTRRLTFPDRVFVLHVDCDVSLQRRQVYSTEQEYALWFNRAFLKHYYSFYRSNLGTKEEQTLHLDTTSMSPAQTQKCLSELIQNVINLHSGVGDTPGG
jgi:thymidylate kinase